MKNYMKKLSALICLIMLIQVTDLYNYAFAESMVYPVINGQEEQNAETDQNTVEPVQTVSPAAIQLQMYNVERSESSNTIFANFKLINKGNEPVNLSDLKIRYYYMLGGEISQNFWCDWSSAGTANVKGTIIRNAPLYQGADTYVEIEFVNGSGTLEAGSNVELKTRFARTDWNNYRQSDDYSFNSNSTNYEDWSKAVVYFGEKVVWGEEPSVLMPQITTAGVKMFNSDRNASTTTIHPWFKLYNTGTLPFNLEDVTIRYYYTSDGDKDQNFWCDWSSAGSENVTGTFVKVPFVANGVDYYYELGFKEGSGSLIAGDFEEIQTRFAKTDWSNYTQTNDYSFNSDANDYIEWTKVGVYIKGKLVWGEGLLFGVPQNIVSSATENGINLSWDPVEGATGFQVEVDGEIMNNEMNSSYVQDNLAPGTMHTYRIRAVNPIMDGDWSDPVGIWTLPEIPQNISASGMGNSIELSWDPVIGASGYDVEVQGAPVDNGLNTTFIQTGLDSNLQQTYRVRAKNSSGTGKWSSIIAKSTLPSMPSNLKYTATDNEIKIYWNAAAGAGSYDVEIDGEAIISTPSAFYIHTGLSPYTEHFYRVRAKKTDGVSAWSEIIYASTLLPVPSNLEARVTKDGIIVTWDAVENTSGYDIEVDGVIIGNNGSLTSYTHENYQPNTEHSYRVRAKNGSDVSQWSEEITRKTYTGVPANISASATSREIALTWEPVVGALGYELEADGLIINTGMNTFYNHSGLLPGSAHKYRVRAKNTAGASQWSEVVTKSTVLDTPANLRSTSTTATSITIAWDKVQGAVGYDVMVDGTVIDNGTSTSYTHSGLEPGSTHIYIVRAKSGEISGEWGQELSAWSNAIITPSNLGIPGNIKATTTSKSVTLTWDEVNGATGYDVEIDGHIISNGNETMYIHGGLVSLSVHVYRVRAKNLKTVGEWSEYIQAKTSLGIPLNLKSEPQTRKMTLTWDVVEGATGYDIEVDGQISENIKDEKYLHNALQPNTMHTYRVRARGQEGVGEWSELLTDNTVPELVINIAADTMFNFIVVAPAKEDLSEIRVIVSYNPKELEVLDLCGATQKSDIKTGIIEGKRIVIDEFEEGRIIFRFLDTAETQVNVIKFLSKTNTPSSVTYKID